MSDTSQGPGWWQASDLKWYPPDAKPGPPKPAPRPKKKGNWFTECPLWLQLFIVASVIVLVAMAVGVASNSEDDAATSTGSGDHSGSSLACDHFRNVVGDVKRGILTPSELRSKLKEVYDDSSIATARVEAAATALLREGTTGTGSRATQAISEMDAACRAAGH